MGQRPKKYNIVKPPDAELNIDIPISSDENITGVKQDAELQTNISTSSDEVVSVIKQDAELRTDIPVSSDELTQAVKQPTPSIDTNISVSSDTEKVSIPLQTQPINIDIPISSDEVISVAKQSVELQTNIPVSSDELIRVVTQSPVLSPEIVISDDLPLERFEMGFNRGRWLPKGDPLVIGEFNYSELENFRYTDFALESVGGATVVNTTALSGTITGGIHLRTSYNASPTYVLVQQEHGASANTIEANTTAISSQGNFRGTTIYTEDTSGSTARFAAFPRNAVGMCNNEEDLIWAGATMNVGCFMIGTSSTPNTADTNFTNFADYTEKVQNTLDDAFNRITCNDSYGSSEYILLGSTRPIQGVNLEFQTANDESVTIASDANALKIGYDASPADQTVYLTAGSYTHANFLAHIETQFDATLTSSVTATLTSSGALKVSETGHQLVLDVSESTGHTACGFTADAQYDATITADAVLHRARVRYWTGTIFGTVAGFSDGTSSSNIAFGQDGAITWNSTKALARTIYINGYNLYSYLLELSQGTAIIQHATIDADMQPRCNVWDGFYRTAGLVKFVKASDNATVIQDWDLTVAMIAESSPKYDDDSDATYGLNFGQLQATSTYDTCYIEALFDEPTRGIKMKMWDTSNVSQLDASDPTVYVWDGTAWAEATILNDGTQVSSTPLAKSGTILFYASTAEEKTTIDGIKGYAYRLVYASNDATKVTNVVIDTIQGIPRFVQPSLTHKFPFMYKKRTMWCNSIKDKEYNRVDYSTVNAPDVYNGADASGYGNERSLFFGGHGALTGAAELYNLYGDNVETVALFFKNTETYMLTGDVPSDFKIFPVSRNIGCPAPKTITSAEVSFKAKDAPAQNIVLWLSDKGPMMFLNNTIRRIPGVENFFDVNVNSSSNLDTTYIEKASAWFDSTYQEWNLLFPIGTGSQITNNKWIIYDIVRDRWYEKKPHTDAMFPQGAFPVEDAYGNIYNYSYGVDGFLQQEESGLNWQQAPGLSTTLAVAQVITTSDFFFTKSIWDETRIRRLETIWGEADQSEIDAGASLTVTYYYNASTSTTTVTGLPSDKNLDYSGYRIRHLISYIDKIGWCHRFKLAVVNATNKITALGMGLRYQKIKEKVLDDYYVMALVVASPNDILNYTSSEGGPSNIDVANGTYNPFDLALEMQNKLNANNTLTGTGAITFEVSLADGKIKIDSGTGNTIGYNPSDSDVGENYGYTATLTAAQSITAQDIIDVS